MVGGGCYGVRLVDSLAMWSWGAGEDRPGRKACDWSAALTVGWLGAILWAGGGQGAGINTGQGHHGTRVNQRRIAWACVGLRRVR